jgi:hypothetical protein
MIMKNPNFPHFSCNCKCLYMYSNIMVWWWFWQWLTSTLPSRDSNLSHHKFIISKSERDKMMAISGNC